MFIKPLSPDLVIPDPVTFQPLPVEGKEVADNDMFWLRRIQDGDVVEVKPKAEKPAEAKGGEK